jgi:hypothetical protein
MKSLLELSEQTANDKNDKGELGCRSSPGSMDCRPVASGASRCNNRKVVGADGLEPPTYAV